MENRDGIDSICNLVCYIYLWTNAAIFCKLKQKKIEITIRGVYLQSLCETTFFEFNNVDYTSYERRQRHEYRRRLHPVEETADKDQQEDE